MYMYWIDCTISLQLNNMWFIMVWVYIWEIHTQYIALFVPHKNNSLVTVERMCWLWESRDDGRVGLQVVWLTLKRNLTGDCTHTMLCRQKMLCPAKEWVCVLARLGSAWKITYTQSAYTNTCPLTYEHKWDMYVSKAHAHTHTPCI